MKPNLIDKNIIIKIINKNENITETITKKLNYENNSNYFNFLIILLFILFILFLIYRYLEIKNKNNNII